MRERGRLLLRLTHALGLNRLRETVVLPAIADMEHECFEAGAGARCAWAVARGYSSIVTGSAFYAAFVPARHIRENWAGRNAPGPRLLRQAWPVAMVVAAPILGIGVAIWPNEGRLGIGVVALLLPSMVASVSPLALAIGVGWALARDRSGSRAAMGVGLLGAGLSFLFFDVAVTRANQAYRVASYRALTGEGTLHRKGSREMTFRELGAATTLDDAGAYPMQAGMCSCGDGGSPTVFGTEWHKRLSIPALALSFVMLAAGLSRSRRRLVVVLGLWLAFGAAMTLLRFGEAAANQGDIPVVLAAWGAHLVPLTLAALLHTVMGNRTPGPALPLG